MVQGEEECHKIWENEDYMAFLSIFPNTEGFTVVIPKDHYGSYAFDLPDEVLQELTTVCKEVGKLLDRTFDDVGRTGMIFEGFGVDHVHAKLVPMHGTDQEGWEQISSDIDTYFEEYPGYLSSHDSDRVDDETLAGLAEEIRSHNS